MSDATSRPSLAAAVVSPGPESGAESMTRLLQGIELFQQEAYAELREQFESLSAGQAPHTLFITCADSRVAPELITQADPGEIFVCRNIGNIVPAYGEMLGGVSAVIEYAVCALKVKNIVICGHTDCGAMKALSAGPQLLDETMPTVRAWLRNAESARSVVMATHTEELPAKELTHALAYQNVITQLMHLRTHPSVAAGLANGTLGVYGWVFDIAEVRVSVLDPSGAWISNLRHEPPAR
ncbi:MAG: carbonic anhydrase [Janthinobacterium lividum]